MNFFLAVIAFGVMIFVHELGHFLMAKRVGVTVYAFALGFGPALVSFTRGGTRYSINMLPLGGYVRLAGEDWDHTTDPGSFRTKTVWQRLAIVVAGPLMNIVLTVVLVSATAMALGIPDGTTNRIGRLIPADSGIFGRLKGQGPVQTPAQAAGLRPGDTIVAIDGVRMTDGEAVVNTIHSTPCTPTQCQARVLTIERDGKQFDVTVTPRLDPRLGVGLIGFAVEPVHKRVGPIQAAVWGVTITARYTQGIVGAVTSLAGNPRELYNQLAGPVGAGKILGDAARIGIWAYIDTAAVLSVTIGIFNLLPIPALDGGRIVFLLVEAARRRPINPRVEAYVNTAGFALLVLLLITLTWRDIIRQWMGGM